MSRTTLHERKKVSTGVSLDPALLKRVDAMRGPDLSRSRILERLVVKGMAAEAMR